MQKVFVSFHFSEDFNSPDRLLVNRVEGLLRSHGLAVANGEILGGGPLTDKIRALIENCDALIALMTRRDQMANGNYTTHPWVLDEYKHAINKNIPAIAILEKCVPPDQGMYQHNQYIPYDPNDMLTAFLKLSATLGNWREESGRHVKLWIQPDQIAFDYGPDAKWRYRFNRNGVYTQWQDAQLTTEPGGCFLHLPHVLDELALIQVQASLGNSNAESICSPQWVVVNLKEKQHG
jgi:hypothetical protein